MTAKASAALCLLCLFGFTAAPLIASDEADENATTTAVEADEVVLPEREIEFEVSEKPYEMSFRADSVLLEQWHVAVVVFAAGPDSSAARRLPDDLGRRYLGHRQILGATSVDVRYEFFQGLIASLPDQHSLDEEDISFFSDKQNLERDYILLPDLRVGIPPFDRRLMGAGVLILAPTAEAAQQRTVAYLKLLDYGITLPAQQYLREEQRRWEAEAAANEMEIAEIDQAIEEIQQQLQDTEAMSSEELSALRTEQRLLAVELAGTEARIAAAAELLEDLQQRFQAALRGTPRVQQRIEHIENIKLVAEIELAGLSARKKMLDEIVGGGQQRRELENRLRTSRSNKSSHEGEFRSLRREIERYEEASEQVEPFPLREDKVVIHPIEWVDSGRGVRRGE